MLPDGEALITEYLSGHPDIVALGARVAGSNPKTQSAPRLKVTQLDAVDAPNTPFEYLTDHLFQIDCYASNAKDGQQAEANLLARTTREVLKDLEATMVDDIKVTQVRFVGMARIPDTDFEPARERVILSTEIRMHP
jgi:hypothetical protein